jgi:hypothetical protein
MSFTVWNRDSNLDCKVVDMVMILIITTRGMVEVDMGVIEEIGEIRVG